MVQRMNEGQVRGVSLGFLRLHAVVLLFQQLPLLVDVRGRL
jgi:hypothetical protein